MSRTAEQAQIMRIFYPYAMRKHDAVISAGTRFVHYTSAEAAMSILRNREVWMRKSSCMNDFMEVQHGLNCILPAYKSSDPGKAFRTALDAVFEGVSKEIEVAFNGWMPHFLTGTYLACFSEHDDREDPFGRLSMWRAYGHGTGIALVLNNSSFLGDSDALKAYTSPVGLSHYGGPPGRRARAKPSDEADHRGS